MAEQSEQANNEQQEPGDPVVEFRAAPALQRMLDAEAQQPAPPVEGQQGPEGEPSEPSAASAPKQPRSKGVPYLVLTEIEWDDEDGHHHYAAPDIASDVPTRDIAWLKREKHIVLYDEKDQGQRDFIRQWREIRAARAAQVAKAPAAPEPEKSGGGR